MQFYFSYEGDTQRTPRGVAQCGDSSMYPNGMYTGSVGLFNHHPNVPNRKPN